MKFKEMKASELRIGNWVTALGEERQVLGISNRLRPDCGYYEFENIKIPIKGIHINPIPLTEEWLVKFGFEEVDTEWVQNFRIKAGDYYNSIKFYDNEWCYNNDSSDAGCYFVTTIEYVHQLQNLYFAINGKELIINQK